MKYSNFKIIKAGPPIKDVCKASNIIATVDVEIESGFWLWKKKTTVTKEVISEYGTGWYFVEDGEWANISHMYKYWEMSQ